MAVEEQVAHSRELPAPTDEDTRYREQVGRVFNRISLTGLPERDPRLNELPLDQVFVTLAIEVQQAAPPRNTMCSRPAIGRAHRMCQPRIAGEPSANCGRASRPSR